MHDWPRSLVREVAKAAPSAPPFRHVAFTVIREVRVIGTATGILGQAVRFDSGVSYADGSGGFASAPMTSAARLLKRFGIATPAFTPKAASAADEIPTYMFEAAASGLGGARDTCIPGEWRIRQDVAVRAHHVVAADGTTSQDVRWFHRARASATAGGNGDASGTGRSIWVGAHPPNPAASIAVAKDALGEAWSQHLRLEGARATGGGRMDTAVFLHPRAAGALIHELIGHPLEVDNFANPHGYFRHAMGTQITPVSLTIDDDATIPEGWGSYAFDDEGAAGRRTRLVEEGIVRATLNSSQAVDEAGSTGNARRESYAHPVLPRATNLVVAPGRGDEEERLIEASGMDPVLVVRDFASASVAPRTGEFHLLARDACLRGGEGADRIRQVHVHGVALDALATLEGIGSTAETDNVTCGKGGQSVGIGLRSPGLRFGRLSWT